MSPGIWQIIIVALLAILLLGGGRFSSMMGDVAKGLKSFKEGMSDEDNESSHKASERKEPSRLESKPLSDPKFDSETERHREER